MTTPNAHATEEPIHVEVDYVPADLQAYAALAQRRALKSAWPVWVLLGLFYAAFMFLATASPARQPAPSTPAPHPVMNALLPCAAALAVIAIFAGVRRWAGRRAVRRMFDRPGYFHRRHSAQFRAEGISITEPLSRHEYLWPAIVKTHESKSAFLLHTSESSAWIVPKRCFRPGDVDRMRRLLRAAVDTRSTLQAFPVLPVLPAEQNAAAPV